MSSGDTTKERARHRRLHELASAVEADARIIEDSYFDFVIRFERQLLSSTSIARRILDAASPHDCDG